MVNDEEMLAFLRKQAEGAKYVTSVCTGSLVLGAAGLLKGYRAATHWTAMDFLARVRRDPDQDAGLRRPQPHHRRRRHRRHRFRADAGVDPGRPPDRGSDPAPARIQSGAAVQLRLARHRAAGSSGAAEGADRAVAGSAAARRSSRAAARLGVTSRCVTARPLKEKGRLVSQTAFPVLRQPHIDGRSQNLCTGGLSPGRILIGCRCISGQSRTGARTDAMVSHLRKMT